MTSKQTRVLKQRWRRWASMLEVAPSVEENRAIVDALAEYLYGHDGSLLTYRPMPSELDLDSLTSILDQSRFLTTRTPSEGPLTIHRFDAPTEVHRYGFVQPAEGSEEVDPSEIGVVLVPGVLFTPNGTRLGHGMGYYDRLLASLGPGTQRIGVTVVARVVAGLPSDAHDSVMTHLATPAGVSAIAQRTT